MIFGKNAYLNKQKFNMNQQKATPGKDWSVLFWAPQQEVGNKSLKIKDGGLSALWQSPPPRPGARDK